MFASSDRALTYSNTDSIVSPHEGRDSAGHGAFPGFPRPLERASRPRSPTPRPPRPVQPAHRAGASPPDAPNGLNNTGDLSGARSLEGPGDLSSPERGSGGGGSGGLSGSGASGDPSD